MAFITIMRIVFLTITVILMQLLTLGLAQGVRWLIDPLWQPKFWVVAVVCLVVSNALLATLFLGMFRYGMGWLAVLWLTFLSALVSMGVIWILTKLGVSSPWSHRGVALGSWVLILALSVYNAYTPVVRHQTIYVDKPLAAPIKMAVVSDLHLGALFGNAELNKLTAILRRENVDMLLMPGDIMDDDTVQFEAQGMASAFKQMAQSVPVAVATLGNHDLYRTHAYQAINRAIVEAGIVLLKDESKTVTINKQGNAIAMQIVGRYDDHHEGRLPTHALMASLNDVSPTIVLDHRPTDIEAHSLLPIDLQVSGHTHNGQIFPANLIVNAINRIGYGYEKINNTHFLVTSGFGFWGVPFRLGTQSEIWIVEMVGR